MLLTLKNTRYMQYAAALIATISIPSGTIYTTWVSPALVKLELGDSPLGRPITKGEGSWIASITLLGSIPGGLLMCFLAERISRKYFLLVCALLLFAPWIACILAKSVLTLIIARFIGGCGLSMSQTLVPVYIGEIADKDIRGRLGALCNVLKLSGSLIVLSIGPFVTYTRLAIICSVFPVLFLVLFPFMPESPYYLMRSGKKVSAERCLSELSANENTRRENLDQIRNTINFDMKNKSSFRELFLNGKYHRTLIIMLGIKTLQQFSGMGAIDAYTQTIIQSSGSSITPEVSSIICGVIQIPAGLLSVYLVDRVGRKPLWIVSSLGCALALTAEGTYFYLQSIHYTNLDIISWLPTTALMFYLVMNPIGLFTLPYVLIGELFSTNVKDKAASICTLYSGTLAFIVIKFFNPISELWGMYTMFWIFAGFCFFGAFIISLALPETKGSTFLEIQEKLDKR